MTRISRTILLDTIRTKRPASLDDLRESLKKTGVEFTDEELLGLVEELESENVLVLERTMPTSFPAYLGEFDNAWWLYAVMIICPVETSLVVYAPHDLVLGTVRILLGLGLLGYIPGYCVIRAIFPETNFHFLERLILSVFVSVIVSVSLGTILGSVSLFEASSNVVLLSWFTIISALVAAYRGFKALRKQERLVTTDTRL